ncbi:MAG: GntR family transcriptional regulator [Bryobacteraceae bacterium]
MTGVRHDLVVPTREPKYKKVLESLASDIRGGKYKPGQKLPSESALIQQFGTSRITVGHALRELTQRGMIRRVAGSGSFVKIDSPQGDDLLFGLLIPNLGETEIFGPICQGMAAARPATPHALLWGQTDSTAADKGEQALRLCRQFITHKVAGVFFAPLELDAAKDRINQEIAARLDAAGIPVVLLDHDVVSFPQRSGHDLIGVDNRRAAYLATEHLLELGCRRIGFVGLSGAAPTVEARIAGYREALFSHDAAVDLVLVQRLPAITPAAVRAMLNATRAKAFVCANDRTAGTLMQVLLELGLRIPQDIRIVGMDDVEYASLLPVPLTTIHQPCREIGEAAVEAMVERIAHPGLPARDILLDCQLVVRKSSGA